MDKVKTVTGEGNAPRYEDDASLSRSELFEELNRLREGYDHAMSMNGEAIDTIAAQRDELLAALKETQIEDLSDVRGLADAILNDPHHSVTGTQAERIAYLLNWYTRCVRVANAAIAKAEGK